MESNWAAENLQTIRTLMERSAIYRRALAPVMIFLGVVGVAAAIVGWVLKIESPAGFPVYWMAVCAAVIAGAALLVRRQALKNGEPFWSPPTRRIAHAMVPALLVGFVLGLIFLVVYRSDYTGSPLVTLVSSWTILYGLALTAAGFFMPRGIKLFGWGFIVAGLVVLALLLLGNLFDNGDYVPRVLEYLPYLLMGVIFGCSHLAYGIYLYFTEPRKNET